MSMLNAALALAELGLQVFALQPRSKHPATGHGCKDATSDAAALRAMWGDSTCNVGVAMGLESGVFVLDVDGSDADLTLRSWQAIYGSLPPTPTTRTAKGYHLWFRHPGEQVAIRNSVGKVAAGIDVRTDGGYVVAPPSVHPDGPRYAWEDGKSPVYLPFANAPDWLIAKLVDKPKAAPPSEPQQSHEGHTRYGERALADECMELMRTPEGQRNAQLNVVAFRVGQLVAAGHLAEGPARADLRRSAHACGLDERETAATIASGFKAGYASPNPRDPRPGQYEPQAAPADADAPASEPSQPEQKPAEAFVVMTAHEAAKSALDYLTDPSREAMARTGFVRLDDAIGGLPPGTMHTIGGRTGSGKSSLILAMAMRQSRSGHRIGIVSCEDAEWVWGARVIASLRNVNPDSFFKQPLDPQMVGLAKIGVEEARDYGVHFAFTIGRPIKFVLDAIARLVSREAVNVIMVDYLQAIMAKGQDRYVARTDAAQEIKGLCHRLGVPLVLSSQLKRAENGSPFKPPTNNDLKDSGDIENMSESIVLMWPTSDEERAPVVGKVTKIKWSDKRPRFRLERNPLSGAVVNLVEPPAEEPKRGGRGFMPESEGGWYGD